MSLPLLVPPTPCCDKLPTGKPFQCLCVWAFVIPLPRFYENHLRLPLSPGSLPSARSSPDPSTSQQIAWFRLFSWLSSLALWIWAILSSSGHLVLGRWLLPGLAAVEGATGIQERRRLFGREFWGLWMPRCGTDGCYVSSNPSVLVSFKAGRCGSSWAGYWHHEVSLVLVSGSAASPALPSKCQRSQFLQG